jgi:large subunit ribosomal protein L18
MKKLPDKIARRRRRKLRIRKKILGTPDRPRISIYKSNRFTYVQAVDDTKGYTIATASTREKELAGIKNGVSDLAKLGEVMADRLKKKNITNAVFDRNGYLYHGRVASVAEGLRKAGIRL